MITFLGADFYAPTTLLGYVHDILYIEKMMRTASQVRRRFHNMCHIIHDRHRLFSKSAHTMQEVLLQHSYAFAAEA